MIPRVDPEKDNIKKDIEITLSEDKNISKTTPICLEMKSNDVNKDDVIQIHQNDVKDPQTVVAGQELDVGTDKKLKDSPKNDIEPKKSESDIVPKQNFEKNENCGIKEIDSKEIIPPEEDKNVEKEKNEEQIKNKTTGMF